MKNINSLCVFCGSRFGNDPAYEQTARELGAVMADKGIRLIYGGGGIGLMGVVANAVMENGGEVIGVIPKFLDEMEVGKLDITKLIITNNMHERKSKMFELSDGFISLPGGLGTLDETFEIMTWKQLKVHSKPVIILDVAGYWSELSALINALISKGFADQRIKGMYHIVGNTAEVFATLDSFSSSNGYLQPKNG
jgi:uncharacterized protein (TIGR00730 family)